MLACAPGASAQVDLPRLPDTPVTPPVQQVADQAEDTANQIVNQTPVGSPPSNNNNPPTGNTNPSGSGSAPNSNGGGSNGPSTRGDGSGGDSGSSGDRGSAADRRAARRRAERRDARRAAAAAERRDRRDRAAKDNGGGGSNDDGPGVLRPVRDVVEVIPVPMWIALGLLALLAGGFYVRSMLAARRARGLEEQRTELMGDIGLLQKALLPEVPARIGGLDASVAYRPAEGPAAGGDFYDVFEMEGNRVGIIVGDVCGHGRQALAVTALMRYSLRAYLNAGGEPRVALQIAARALENEQDADLTTVVLAVYDAPNGTLSYACAGHEPPILIGPGAHEPVTVGSSPPIGAGATTGLRQTTVALPPGASACFFTDGLVEARLHGDDLLGRDRLTKIVEELGPGANAAALLERIATTAERAPDDMAACIVRAGEAAVPSPNVRIEDLELDALDTGDRRARGFLAACAVPPAEADGVLKTAAGAIAEFGGALLRVRLDAEGGALKVVPLEMRSLATSPNGTEPTATVPAAPPLNA